MCKLLSRGLISLLAMSSAFISATNVFADTTPTIFSIQPAAESPSKIQSSKKLHAAKEVVKKSQSAIKHHVQPKLSLKTSSRRKASRATTQSRLATGNMNLPQSVGSATTRSSQAYNIPSFTGASILPVSPIPQRNFPVGDGKLVILKATYGVQPDYVNDTDNVTDAITNWFRDGEPALIVHPEIDGGRDPAPGNTKFLNIDYIVNGQHLKVSESDGDPITLPQAQIGDSSVQILNATYGIERDLRQPVDITDDFSQWFQSGGRRLNVNNSLDKGNDPARLDTKQLEVDYELGGRTITVIALQNNYLTLPDLPAGSNGIVIHRALYGPCYRSIDVTSGVSSMVSLGIRTIAVNNDLSNGVDPAPGELKTLDVTYSEGGITYTKAVAGWDTFSY